MKVSVITTMYQSESYLDEFYSRIVSSLNEIELDYEIIFVNDGSPDKSLNVAIKIQRKDPKVKVIDLSRNFGHHKAILTGLSYTDGDLVFLIDCDLEEEPENLGVFYDELTKNEHLDVVYGIQEQRKGSLYRKYAGALFYKLFNSVSDVKVSNNQCTIRLMSRRYVDSLLTFKDKNVFLAAMFENIGYEQKGIRINKEYKGSSAYSLSRKVKLMVEGVTSFSSKPLTLIIASGYFISLIAFMYTIYLILRKLFISSFIIGGWTSVMVSIWFLSGLIISAIGMVGIYISKIFNEVKERPLSVVKKVYDSGEAGEN